MKLTRRQMDVARLVAEGQTTQGIMATLFIVQRTAEHHLNAIYARLKPPARMDKRVYVALWYLRQSGRLAQ